MAFEGAALFAVAIVVLGAIGYLVYRHEQKRRAAFAALATGLGLEYQHDLGGPGDDLRRLEAFRPGGHGHRLLDVVKGRYRERDVMSGDLKYLVTQGHGKTRSTTTHYRGFTMMRVPPDWPWLTLEAEHIGLKIADALGADDIDFESEEFSSAFWVKSADRKFAHDLIHPRAMEYLLANKGWHWELRAGWLVVWRKARHRPEAIQPELDLLVGFLALTPTYLTSGGRA